MKPSDGREKGNGRGFQGDDSPGRNEPPPDQGDAGGVTDPAAVTVRPLAAGGAGRGACGDAPIVTGPVLPHDRWAAESAASGLYEMSKQRDDESGHMGHHAHSLPPD